MIKKTTRKAIGEKARFEVFKRDGFKCQYCGAHPPSVILEVDHIHPVSDGGGNDSDNLVTACFSCNRGKSDISLNLVPQSLSDKAALVSETEAQLKGYQAVMEEKRQRIDEELWSIAEILQPGSSTDGMSRQWTGSIRNFLGRIGLDECLDAADIARSKFPYAGKRAFLYFCGVCWRKVKEAESSL